MKVFRAESEPARLNLSWEQRWKGSDEGLIASWEAGRDLARRERVLERRPGDPPSVLDRALAGELPTLPWKGGVEDVIKGRKYGSFKYLAMLQGILGQALDIHTGEERVLTCARTGMQVTYTADRSKFVTE